MPPATASNERYERLRYMAHVADAVVRLTPTHGSAAASASALPGAGVGTAATAPDAAALQMLLSIRSRKGARAAGSGRLPGKAGAASSQAAAPAQRRGRGRPATQGTAGGRHGAGWWAWCCSRACKAGSSVDVAGGSASASAVQVAAES